MIDSQLQIYRKILLSLRDREDSHDKFVGWLKFDLDTVSKFKMICEAGLAASSVKVKKITSSNATSIDIDKVIEKFESKFSNDEWLFQIELEKNNLNQGNKFLICADWNELLSFEHYVINPVYEVYFTTSDSYFDKSSQDEKYKNYLKVGKVFEFINFLSEQTKSDPGTIFFNRSYKFSFNLTESCLESSVDSESLENLMNKDMHREAIIHLMTKEVTNFIKDQDEKNRFIHIIQNLNPLIHHINHSYQSYVDNYSFDKVRKEYLEKKTEYIKKMNESYDSVATKMLAVPAGIWFVTAQITKQVNTEFDASKNLIVLVTVCSVVIVFIMNIWGHKNTLSSMREEYLAIFNALSLKFQDESILITNARDELDKKAFWVNVKMWFSIIVTFVLLLFTIVLFYQDAWSFEGYVSILSKIFKQSD
ncbi:hypothetical protein ACT43K_16950 [Acinetobacter baumannii]